MAAWRADEPYEVASPRPGRALPKPGRHSTGEAEVIREERLRAHEALTAEWEADDLRDWANGPATDWNDFGREY